MIVADPMLSRGEAAIGSSCSWLGPEETKTLAGVLGDVLESRCRCGMRRDGLASALIPTFCLRRGRRSFPLLRRCLRATLRELKAVVSVMVAASGRQAAT